MSNITIEYRLGVHTRCGHRSVTIRALAERTSEKWGLVKRVVSIDGEAPAYKMSRTGATRQEYNGRYVAELEQGKRKRLSACTIIE